MDDPLAQLYDIEGLDPISWWPLAIGWWALLAIVMVALIALSYYFYRRRIYRNSWQKQILENLKAMEQNLVPQTSLQTARELSELIRRIGIDRYSRQQCAKLTGKEWLLWLKSRDPARFDWESQGQWLVNLIYAPDGTIVPSENLRNCIQAIRRWVK